MSEVASEANTNEQERVNYNAYTSLQSNRLPVASNSKRVGAFLLDGVIGIPISLVIYKLLAMTGLTDQLTLGILGNVLISVLYYFIPTAIWGQTIGKFLLGIKVISTKNEKSPGFGKAFMRELLGKTVSGIVLMIGFIWGLFEKERRTWHDFIGGTRVVQIK